MITKYIRFFIKDYLTVGLSLIFVILYWKSAYSLPLVSIRYSIIISVIACLFIIGNIVDSVIQFKKVYAAEGDDKEKYDITLGFNKKKLIVIAATTIYAICIPIVGYVVSTVIYLFLLCFYLLNWKKPIVSIVYSVALTAFFYQVFHGALSIRLPDGFFI
jgi:hypothetical protein